MKFVANNLKCEICFNIFTKPVTLVCGHNYCHTCIKECWAKSVKRDCPHCRKEINSSALEINFTLCDILELQELGGRTFWDILAETDQDHKTQHAGRAITKVDSLIKRLDWLKAEIRKTEDMLSEELDSKKDYKDGCDTVQMDGSSIDSYPTSSCYADRIYSLTSQERSEEEGSLEFVEVDPENSNTLEDAHLTPSAEAQQQSSRAEAALPAKFVDLSFCPELGNKRLIFCPEKRSLATRLGHQGRTTHGRFDACQWMANQELGGGCFYWDVDTTHCTGWAVGVAYSSLMRRDRLGRTSSSWCLEWSSGQLGAWHNDLKTSVKHRVPSNVRVILDMAKGKLYFQSLCENLLELHCFKVSFSHPVRPVFWLYGLTQNTLSFPKH